MVEHLIVSESEVYGDESDSREDHGYEQVLRQLRHVRDIPGPPGNSANAANRKG